MHYSVCVISEDHSIIKIVAIIKKVLEVIDHRKNKNDKM
jgi:hypothetical protein